MDISRSVQILAFAVSAIASTAGCTQPPGEEQRDRRLTVVCYQADGRTAASLSNAGMGAGEARIELTRNSPPKAWFDGKLYSDFDLSITTPLALGLLRDEAQEVSIHVFDDANQADMLLIIIARASEASRKQGAMFNVERRFAIIDTVVLSD